VGFVHINYDAIPADLLRQIQDKVKADSDAKRQAKRENQKAPRYKLDADDILFKKRLANRK
jgi:hypothetical protein